MATIRISVMTIIAMVVMVACILAVSLYEYDPPSTLPRQRTSLGHAYEVMLIIAILLAVVIVGITCLNNASLSGKTYLIFAFTSFWLVIAVICYGIDGVEKVSEIASLVFAIIGILVSAFGIIFPFVWRRVES